MLVVEWLLIAAFAGAGVALAFVSPYDETITLNRASRELTIVRKRWPGTRTEKLGFAQVRAVSVAPGYRLRLAIDGRIIPFPAAIEWPASKDPGEAQDAEECAAGLRMALGLADGSPPGAPIPKVAAARVSNEPLMLRGKGVRRRSRRDNPVGGSG